MDPAFIGSDSKVSWGTASEDVGVAEEEGRVQRVLEQEVWERLVIEAVLEPEIEAVPERDVESPETDEVMEGLMVLVTETVGS